MARDGIVPKPPPQPPANWTAQDCFDQAAECLMSIHHHADGGAAVTDLPDGLSVDDVLRCSLAWKELGKAMKDG